MYTPDHEKPFALFPLGLAVEFRFHWRGDIFRGGILFHGSDSDLWVDPEGCAYSERGATLVFNAAREVASIIEDAVWDGWADYCGPLAHRERMTAQCVALALVAHDLTRPCESVSATAARAFVMGLARSKAAMTWTNAERDQSDWDESEEGRRQAAEILYAPC